MVVGGLGARGAVDVVLSGELLTVGDGGSVRLELDVEDCPVGDDGFEPRPIEDDLSSELVDPPAPADAPDPDRLDPERLDDERLDPDKLEDPAVLDGRLDGAGVADKGEAPLVPTEEPEVGESGVPLALLMLDDSGLVEVRLLPTVGLDTPELGLHGCRNGVGSAGGVTGEVGLCTEPGV